MRAALAEVLTERAGHRVEVRTPSRGLPLRWVELTRENAAQGLRMRFAQKQGMDEMLADLARVLDLPEAPQRMECFDISHTGGEGTVASCVVFGTEGPLKKEYRRFNITGVTPGDDYAALRQALDRRYRHVQEGEVPAPDILLIDGGIGQIGEVHEALAQLGFADLTLVGVAKGPDRKRRPGAPVRLWGRTCRRARIQRSCLTPDPAHPRAPELGHDFFRLVRASIVHEQEFKFVRKRVANGCELVVKLAEARGFVVDRDDDRNSRLFCHLPAPRPWENPHGVIGPADKISTLRNSVYATIVCKLNNVNGKKT